MCPTLTAPENGVILSTKVRFTYLLVKPLGLRSWEFLKIKKSTLSEKLLEYVFISRQVEIFRNLTDSCLEEV